MATSWGILNQQGNLGMPTNKKAVLDTHTFIWFALGIQLDSKIADKIEGFARAGHLYISDITLWEIAMLAKSGKIKLRMTIKAWLEKAVSMPGLHVIPICPSIAFLSSDLPEFFHGDPADRLIVATAMNLKSVLFTRDSRILDLAPEYIECVEV